MSYLDKAKEELLSMRPLPDGYRVEIDGFTDNILVYGPTRGFCVTKEAILDNLYKTEYVPALEALIAEESAV